MVTKTLPASEVEDCAYNIRRAVALCGWIEEARTAIDAFDFATANSALGQEFRKLYEIHTPDWDLMQSEGLRLLQNCVSSDARDLELAAANEDAAQELSPDEFDALSSTAKYRYLAEVGLRCLPQGMHTNESRRCLT